MLGPLRLIIRNSIIYGMYGGGIIVMITSIFKRAEWGLFFIAGLVSQPNVWYKLAELPLGNDFIDLLFVSVFIGIFINKRPVSKTGNLIIILLFLLSSYIALWNSTSRFYLPLPISTANPLLKPWKNYAMMIMMYFLALNAIKNERHQKILVIIMALVMFHISLRSYRSFIAGASFADDSRYAGPFWIVGLGSNHLGALIADYSAALFGLFLLDTNKKRKLLFLGTCILCLHPLFFSYSRGAYAAAFAAAVLYGVLKKRSILILLTIVFISYNTLLPPSVVERINMTKSESGQLESSAAARVGLWDAALDLFQQSPLYGVGFDGFRLSREGQYGVYWTDTHNYFLKKLCEEGMIGMFLLVTVFLAAFRSGWKLFRCGSSGFQKGLGFGLIGCTLSLIATNMFGDRFSYVELGSFFWIFWGLVDRGIIISNEAADSVENTDNSDRAQESVIGVNKKTMLTEA